MRKRVDETDEEFKARVALYAKNRRIERKSELIKMLGGKCVDCGFTENLEFDHIDPKQKKFGIAAAMATRAWDKLVMEAKKCELRCIACHAHRTAFQRLEGLDILGDII